MDNIHSRPHAIMFPLPLQGHVIPAANLAIKLASIGFTITFVNAQFIHQKINQHSNGIGDEEDMFATARRSGLDIRYTTVRGGFPVSHSSEQHRQYFSSDFELLPLDHIDELIGNMVNSVLEPPITCLVADTFFSWSANMAAKYKLVSVSFWTQPALVYSIYHHMDMLKINGHFASDHEMEENPITYIPGVPVIDFKDLPSYMQDKNASIIVSRTRKAFDNVRRVDFVLFNTTEELESETIAVLQNEAGPEIYATGPIFSCLDSLKSAVPSSILHQSDCVNWLNTKPQGSVLYVSFGSLYPVGKQDILELACALFHSKVNFLWVLPPHVVGSDSEMNSFLPAGFKEDIEDKGLIIQWCNQMEAISHSAIGGFLSHCGWNSTLESIWCGVPLLCFPIQADQTTNRMLIVDDWKFGLNLCPSKSITRQEAARNINLLMGGTELAVELRSNVNKIRKIMQKALGGSGSTEKNLYRFMNDVVAKLNSKSFTES